MNLIEKVGLRAVEIFKGSKRVNLSDIKTSALDLTQNKKKRMSSIVISKRIYFSIEGQDDLRNAIEMAKNVQFPDRTLLNAIYEETMRDTHVRSQIRTAISEVISEPWAIVKHGTNDINQDLTALMQKQWFDDTMRAFLEAEFWGFSLIELGVLENDNDTGKLVLKKVVIFPRANVRPEQGLLMINQTDPTGIPFRDEPFNTYLLEAGDPHDLGLLEILSRYSIYKKFSISDWSISSEKWADPLLWLGSSSDDDDENQKKAEFAANFAKNGFIITDDEDKIQLLERKSGGDSHKIYLEYINLLNEENSKGVNGQTGTSDTKSFVGSAEVHERILQGFTTGRLKDLTYWINDVLRPKLIEMDGGSSAYAELKGHQFKPIRFMKELKPPVDPSFQPDPNNPEDPKKGGIKGKKPYLP